LAIARGSDIRKAKASGSSRTNALRKSPRRPFHPVLITSYGRGGGVRRTLGLGPDLGLGVDVGIAVAVGVGVGIDAS